MVNEIMRGVNHSQHGKMLHLLGASPRVCVHTRPSRVGIGYFIPVAAGAVSLSLLFCVRLAILRTCCPPVVNGDRTRGYLELPADARKWRSG
eukprot:6736958-Prymnesium_polylepis.1